MQDLKDLAPQVENLSMAVNRYNDLVLKFKTKPTDPEDLKTLSQLVERMRGLSSAINDQLTTHTITPRIADDQVQADQSFHESLEASLQGWEAELLLIQKEQIDQAVIDAKAGARSSRYIALVKRDKDLQAMIADARTKLGKVSERVANAAFSNQVSNIVNAAKP